MKPYRVARIVLVAWLLLAWMGVPAAQGQETPPVSTFQECEQVDEAALRDELNRLAQQAFADGQTGLDLAARVAAQWQALGVDPVVQAQVAAAVAQVRQDTGYWDRFLSGWSGAKAEELAQQVASIAFGSTAFRAKMEELAGALGQDMAEELAQMATRSASSSLLCVQDFIGGRFSATMATLFAQELRRDLDAMDLTSVEVDLEMPFLEANPRALAGLGVIVGTQMARRVATRIAERVAERVVGRLLGKAASTLIPLVGWVVGGGLILWDLVEGADGALPQIQEALTGPETAATIQAQIAEELGLALEEQAPLLARTISNEIYSRWVDFRGRYRRVLDWANREPRFRSLLDNARPEEVERLARLVTLAEERMEPEALEAFVGSPAFERILALSDTALTLFAHTGDPDAVLAWADLAGSSLDQVVAAELYRVAQAEDFPDRETLEQVLALEDLEAMAQVMALAPEERQVLLRLPGGQVRRLASTLPLEDLHWMARYLQDLEPRPGYVLVDRVLTNPNLMDRLRDEETRRQVLRSRNLPETLEFLDEGPAEPSSVALVGRLLDDGRRVLRGQVPWQLFWRKYGPWPLVGVALAGLLVVLLLARLLWPRRPVQVTVHIPERRED